MTTLRQRQASRATFEGASRHPAAGGAAAPSVARDRRADRRRDRQGRSGAWRAAALRAGDGRGDGRQPDRGARGGGGAQGGRAGGDAAGRRRLCRRGRRTAAVPARRRGVEHPRSGAGRDGVAGQRRDRGGRARGGARLGGGALARIDAAIRRGENAVDQDFAFHRAIAAATGNPQFSRFLEYLGRFIIPRQSVRLAVHREGGQRAYLERIQDEHGAILVAIEAGAAEAAREAMRVHLANSQERYRRIAAEARAPGAVPPSLSTTPTGPAGRGRRG